ncbi:hypothetical protein DL770_000157 [Monosporascus sp. CRB-9-2]|nr:hypothetical protein DL770_000157 [Monosporascus sp. CRB-9-2]
MIVAVSLRVQDQQGNQHGNCSDVADGDVQGQQPRLLVVFETSMNVLGYSLGSWINYSVSFVGRHRCLAVSHWLSRLSGSRLQRRVRAANATRWRGLLRGRTKAAVSLPIQYVFYPETANCTFEDLDAYYRGDPPLLAFRDLDSVSVRRRARFALAHDRDVEEAAQDLRRRSIFAHPGYKSSGDL